MRLGIPVAILSSATLTGCAASPRTFEVEESHPASAAAAEAPPPQLSATLALTSGDGAGQVSDPMAEQGGAGHDQHGHAEGDAMEDEAPADMDHAALDPYVCPMHPQITSKEASARCEICGMKLVLREEVEDQ